MTLTRETTSSGLEIVPVPFCLTQIRNRPSWNRCRVSAITSRY